MSSEFQKNKEFLSIADVALLCDVMPMIGWISRSAFKQLERASFTNTVLKDKDRIMATNIKLSEHGNSCRKPSVADPHHV
jgi:hypothetical protein